ncbi:MAG: hypothetical protein IPN76_17495 [Saprospiraceae bacterium]|nr:hypothetical protein [Saprospiraceae bacterium]
MVKVKDIFQNRNQFDAKEIGEVSNFMFEAFYFDDSNWQQSLDTRIAMLKGYIEVLRQLLYSDLVQSDSKKLMLVDALDKLVAQQELFEVAFKNEAEIKNLTKTAERFGKKTQHSIGI